MCCIGATVPANERHFYSSERTFVGLGECLSENTDIAEAGSAVVVEQDDLSRLPGVVADLLTDETRLLAMAAASRAIAKPDAARTIAKTMIEAVR